MVIEARVQEKLTTALQDSHHHNLRRNPLLLPILTLLALLVIIRIPPPPNPGFVGVSSILPLLPTISSGLIAALAPYAGPLSAVFD